MRHTRELAHETWSEYFDALSRELVNASIAIEIDDATDPPMRQAEHLVLRMLTYDRRGDVFEVAASRAGPRLPSVLRHRVDHPQRVAVDNQTMLAPMTVRVDGRDGARTVIRIEREADISS